MPLGDEPLQRGFVEVIRERPPGLPTPCLQAERDESDRSCQVVISIWTSNLTCSGDPQFVLPSAVLVTNASRNGQADAVFDPELVAALGLRDLTIGGNVTLVRDGSPAYAIGCQVIQHD